MKRQFSLRQIWDGWRLWLILGMGIKRWLVVLGVGAVLTGIGVSSLLIALRQWGMMPSGWYRLVTLQFLPLGWRIFLTLLSGTALIIAATIRLGANLIAPFRRPDEGILQSLYQYRQRNRGPQVVAIGGGTGLPSLLRGLKQYTSNITAIVTVADDGGSSGRLRRELGVLPPGDFRNNIAALARDEALMTQLLQYRFGSDVGAVKAGEERPLSGHAFGNLLLAALAGITGSFDEALLAAERVLAMRGRVLPSTTSQVTLVAEVAVKEQVLRVLGESAIPKAGGRIKRVSLEPAAVPAYPPAVKAILQADLVVIGPGSLYTSILPNLLVPDIARALQHTRATRIYICNLATQPGETDNYKVADHVEAIQRHIVDDAGQGRRFLDAVLANNNLLESAADRHEQVQFVQPVGTENVPMVTTDLIDEERPWRHDSEKLAQAVIGFVTH